MARLPLSFADEAPSQPHRWTAWRILVWVLLFGAWAVWIGAALLR
jgi:hypothetical protein